MLTLDEDYELPSKINDEFNSVRYNLTKFLIKSSDMEEEKLSVPDPEYEQFLADVWVGIVLTLMVLSCVCFMCSCLIYHKFQQWKTRVIEARNTGNLESGLPESELPSYTIASGLPTYEEALQQLDKTKEPQNQAKTVEIAELTVHTPPVTLNMVKFFQGCTYDSVNTSKAT